ncbi:MAG: DNA polymerase III subunit epsilon [Pseudomonadota bacterium]
MREIIFDTETTGLSAKDGDRVIEIGAIELINRFPTGNTFHMFLNPEGKEVHPDALEVHGISNEFLNDKPTFADTFKEFDQFFRTGSLVAHNASFDLGFLNAELERIGKPLINTDRVVDTLLIARRKFPGQRNSLDALCSRFNIDNSHRDKHGALLDSELLAEVYMELLGGKQASLVLEHSQREAVSGVQTSNTERVVIKPRSRPLPSRLTPDDIKRHEEFVETLGDNPIWKQIGTY